MQKTVCSTHALAQRAGLAAVPTRHQIVGLHFTLPSRTLTEICIKPSIIVPVDCKLRGLVMSNWKTLEYGEVLLSLCRI